MAVPPSLLLPPNCLTHIKAPVAEYLATKISELGVPMGLRMLLSVVPPKSTVPEKFPVTSMLFWLSTATAVKPPARLLDHTKPFCDVYLTRKPVQPGA